MNRLFLFFFSGLLLIACAGCGKSSVATAEGKERDSALYRKAREAEQAGDIKSAIQQYRDLLIEEPRAYSVHFQLAVLLQDFEENYVAALYHYQQYINLRPESDKSPIAQERIRISEQFLAPQILRKVGDTVEGITQAHLLKENDRLNRVITRLEGEKSTMAEAKERAEKERTAALNETERLREIVNRIRTTETVPKPSTPLPKKPEPDPKATERLDTKALKNLRNEAAALVVEDKPTPPPPPPPKPADRPDTKALRNEATDLVAEGNRAPTPKPAPAPATAEDLLKSVQQKVASDTPAPTPEEKGLTTFAALASGAEKADAKKAKPPAGVEPRTHVVQPGEGLFRIAEKYYGDSTKWKKIRDANKTRIDPDGHVRAGQVLVIP